MVPGNNQILAQQDNILHRIIHNQNDVDNGLDREDEHYAIGLHAAVETRCFFTWILYKYGFELCTWVAFNVIPKISVSFESEVVQCLSLCHAKRM